MFKALANLFKTLFAYFTSGKAQKDFQTVAVLVEKAIPYLYIAEQIASGAGVLPPGVAVAVEVFKAKYPQLFDGSPMTDAQRKDLAFNIAAEMVEKKFNVSTSVARSAVQLAYTGEHADGRI